MKRSFLKSKNKRGTLSLKNLFKDSQLEENTVIRYFRITAEDSKIYNTKI